MSGPTAGSVIGSWTLVDLLGRGGMGEVWRARGPDGPAAVKLLGAELSDPSAAARFEREARVHLQVQHPNVVRALDFGRTDSGELYLAMELLLGESLDQLLRKRDGKLTPAEVVFIGRAAGAGLGAAHAAGMIHRDVKPANLFLCTDGTLKVLDFGLALEDALASPRSTQGPRLTAVGMVLGTPSYMSPEQAAGERTEDRRADVWALGAVLHHALSGQPPFYAGGNPIGELFRIITEDPDPLPQTVPSSLVKVIRRALHREPSQRFQNMEELAAALGDVTILAPRAPSLRPSERESSTTLPDDSEPISEAPSTTSSAAIPLAEEVRLVVAVLAEGLWDEAGRELFVKTMRERDGTASTVRGGRAVGVFGGSTWTGDEAERAVDAALAASRHARRIGVGTGKAVAVRGQEGWVTGAALTAAADAMTPATLRGLPTTEAPDTIVDLDAMLEAAEEEQAGIEPPEVMLAAESGDTVLTPDPNAPDTRGKKWAPVRVCPDTRRSIADTHVLDGDRVVARLAGRRMGQRTVGGRTVPFVGRASELARLQAALSRSEEQRRAESLLVIGPPGIGKTRLRHEAARRFLSMPGHRVYLEAKAEVGRRLRSLAIFQDLLRDRAALPEGTPAVESHARIRSLVATAHLPDERATGTIEFVGELLGIPFPTTPHLRTARSDPQVMADRIRLAIGDLLAGWTATGPVFLAVEDAQWADTASLHLLDFLVTRFADHPLTVVVTARPELVEEQPQALPGAERMRLAELSARDIAAIVGGILGHPAPEVVVRAAGNPYFAEELSLAVKEGTATESLPLTVEGAVQARLDKLEPAQKDLLKRAAVVGRRFWIEAVEALGEGDVEARLRPLAERDLVLAQPRSSLAGCSEWTFRHAVVQEVCRGMVTDEQRRALHALLGRWLGARPDAAPEEVAEHHRSAGEAELAQRWWAKAAQVAHTRGDSDKVLLFGERALLPGSQESAPLQVRDEHTLRLRRAEALFWVGRFEEEETELLALETLEQRAPQSIDPVARSESRRRRAVTLVNLGRQAEALQAAWDAVEVAEEAADPEQSARCNGTAAAILASTGQLEEALETAAIARQLAETAGPLARAYAANASGVVASFAGRNAAALAGFTQARSDFRKAGDARHEAMAATNVGAKLQNLGDYHGAREELQRGLQVVTGLGIRHLESAILCNLGIALARLGDPVAGLGVELEAVQRAERAGLRRHVGVARIYRAVIERERGRAQDALNELAAARTALEGSGSGEELLCDAIETAVLVDLGRAADALVVGREAMAKRQAVGGMEELESDLLLACYDALRAVGDLEGARTVLDDAWDSFSRKRNQIEEPRLRAAFSRNIPAHARLLELRGSR